MNLEIAGHKGKIFTVVFRKSDGSVRRLNGRLARYCNLGKVGGGMLYNPENYGLTPVLDMVEYNRYRRNGVDRQQAARLSYRLVRNNNILEINGANFAR